MAGDDAVLSYGQDAGDRLKLSLGVVRSGQLGVGVSQKWLWVIYECFYDWGKAGGTWGLPLGNPPGFRGFCRSKTRAEIKSKQSISSMIISG